MKILNRKVTFKADKLDRTIYLPFSIHVYAKRSAFGWEAWAVDIGFLLWAAGFSVEQIND